MRAQGVMQQLKRWCYKYVSLVEAVLRCTRHILLRRQPRAVFLHSLFRSGSTYLFNTFRNESGFWCYYEPLHHQLIEIRQDRLDIFPFDKETTDRMSHPQLSRPHFYEFQAVLKHDHIPFFNMLMAYNEFTSVRQHARLYKYIMSLLVGTPDKLVPVLQFNRSSLRIGWFRRFFRKSLHVYILRNQRDQFESYFKQGKKYNIFLAINLYIVAANCTYMKFGQAYSFYMNDFRVTHDLYYDLKRLAFFSADVDPKIHYRVFQHLWITSLIEAARHADCILDMDRLSESEEYRAHIVQLFNERFIPVKPSIFDDCQVKRYDTYSLDATSCKEIEDEVRALYAGELRGVKLEG